MIKVFMASVTFLGREFYIPIFGRDLPEQAIIKAIVRRDILDIIRYALMEELRR